MASYLKGRSRLLDRLTVDRIWALAVIVGIFAFLNTHPIRPHDFWWHMAIGRETLETGRIPTVDTYSYTAPGEPYLSYKAFWLMDILLHTVYSAGGPALVVFAHSLLVTAAYTVLLWVCHDVSGSWRIAAFSVLFAAALGVNDWNVRPQAVAFAIAAVFWLAMRRYRATKKVRWLIVFPVGMMLWTNSHGTFPLGLVLLGLWLADEAWHMVKTRPTRGSPAWHPVRDLALALLASSLAVLANPRGASVFGYLGAMSSNPVIQNLVPEWAPPTLNSPADWPFLFGLLLVSALLALSPNRPSPFQILSFLAFGALGLKTVRGSIWFGIILGPTVAEHLSHLVITARRRLGELLGLPAVRGVSRHTAVDSIFAVVLLLGALVTLPWFKPWLPLPAAKSGLVSSETPLAATEFLLDRLPPRPIFHAMSFGSYLAWAAQPDYPVFVDSRIELYSVQTWLDYVEISAASCDWESRLDGYGVQTLMLNTAEQQALVEAVEHADRWQLIYADAAARIYTLATPATP